MRHSCLENPQMPLRQRHDRNHDQPANTRATSKRDWPPHHQHADAVVRGHRLRMTEPTMQRDGTFIAANK